MTLQIKSSDWLTRQILSSDWLTLQILTSDWLLQAVSRRGDADPGELGVPGMRGSVVMAPLPLLAGDQGVKLAELSVLTSAASNRMSENTNNEHLI